MTDRLGPMGSEGAAALRRLCDLLGIHVVEKNVTPGRESVTLGADNSDEITRLERGTSAPGRPMLRKPNEA